MAIVVAGLRARCAQREKLVAHVDERHAGEAVASGGTVAHLETKGESRHHESPVCLCLKTRLGRNARKAARLAQRC